MFRLPFLMACVLVAISLTIPGSVRAGESGTLVVLNKSDATASLVDLGKNKVVATVATGVGPHEVTVSPDGKLAVVCNYGTREEEGSSLTVIDVPAGRAVKTISLGEYRRPHGIAWVPGKRSVVAVTAEDNQALLTVDVEKGEVTKSIPTGQEVSHMVVVSPDGSRAFVANIGSGSITAIDLRKGERISNLATGEGAEGIDITPDGKQVWVTNREADTVTVVDARSLKILTTLESKSFPIRAKVTPDGKSVLVTNARSGEMIVFDADKHVQSHRISMNLSAVSTEGKLFGGQFGKSPVPIGILIPPGGKKAYVANSNADAISVVSLEEWKLVGTLDAGREPDGMAYSPLTVKSKS